MQAPVKDSDDALDAGAGASVTGYIDAVTGSRLFGWAWDPQHPAARITVRLEAGGEVVGMVVADRPREDLKASGVGDGAHAFEALLPEGAGRGAIRVLAVCPETGATVELARRNATGEASGNLDELRQGLQTLMRSQRVLHRNLESALTAVSGLRRGDADPARQDGIDGRKAESKSEALETRLETIEAALLRLDETVHAQVLVTRSLRHDGNDPVARVLAGVAAVLAGATFLTVLLH